MDAAHDLKHRLHEAFKSTVELLTPARSTSAFLELGVLTPEEFVEAGDNLVSKCPTWHWEGGEPSRRKSFLPPEKQYLITRNVPCLRRAGALDALYPSTDGDTLVRLEPNGSSSSSATETAAGGGQAQPNDGEEDDDDVWVATHGVAGPAPQLGGHTVRPEQQSSPMDVDSRQLPSSSDEHIPDISDFSGDPAASSDPASLGTDAATLLTGAYLTAVEPEDDDTILRTRTYDLTVTYDKFYQTPRIWLFGYDEHRAPLSADQVFEDVSQDHIKRTVTIDDHPNLPGKYASVHPCKHSAVMKKIIDIMSSNGSEPRVDQYLVIFLKFVSSIIPTIEYDYTMDFDVGPSKTM